MEFARRLATTPERYAAPLATSTGRQGHRGASRGAATSPASPPPAASWKAIEVTCVDTTRQQPNHRGLPCPWTDFLHFYRHPGSETKEARYHTLPTPLLYNTHARRPKGQDSAVPQETAEPPRRHPLITHTISYP
jgi:hypothetical protein